MQIPALASLAACAREEAARGEPLRTLTPEEGRTLEAMADRVFPGGAYPGARDSGALYFMDRALGSYFQSMAPLLREGARDLDERAAGGGAGARSFADLPDARQVALLTEIQATPFFQAARMLTIAGVLADADYGGNRRDARAALLGMETASSYTPPFGYYDADAARLAAGGGA